MLTHTFLSLKATSMNSASTVRPRVAKGVQDPLLEPPGLKWPQGTDEPHSAVTVNHCRGALRVSEKGEGSE